MMRVRDLTRILLALWLIATGVLALVPALNSAMVGMIMAIVAIAAGVLMLIRR
jgi:hypothetical protein